MLQININLPVLYALDKRGSILQFSVTVKEHSTHIDVISNYGQRGGKITAKATKVKEGKAGRSLQEQVILKIESLYNSKKDEGYKSFEDLKECFNVDTLEEGLDNLQILGYNTNVDWFPLPMLAEPLNKVKTDSTTFFAQPKFNGVRCLAIIKEGYVIFMSRGGKYYQGLKHIESDILALNLVPDTILDGELYNHDLSLQEISGIVRTEDFTEEKLKIKYYIYDLVNDSPQAQRLMGLDMLNIAEKHLLNLVNVGYYTINKSEIKEFHNTFVKNGYEGLILREKQTYYAKSFRDKCLIKVKEFIDEEFTIIGCKVNDAQTIGDSFVFQLVTEEGKEFFARPKGTREKKEVWYKAIDNIIGEKATVRYFERTEDNIPSHGHVLAIRNYE